MTRAKLTTLIMLAGIWAVLPAADALGQTVMSGLVPHQEDLIGARFKSLANTGDKEIYLGVPELGVGSRRADVNVTWAAGDNNVTFEYDAFNDLLTATVTNVNGTFSVDYPVLPDTLTGKVASLTSGDFTLADLNIMQISVTLRDAGASLDFTNVTLDGNTLGTGTFNGVFSGTQNWMVTDYDFTNGFLLAGTVTISAPGTFGGNEVSKIDIRVGHLNECGDGVVEPGGANGPAEDCDDGNTEDGDCCSSTCEFDPVDTPCPDADLCNGDETCDGAGTCLGGVPLDCDDGVDCTLDSCDVGTGCVNTTDDGICDDDNVCTADVCDPLGGCTNEGTPLPSCRAPQKSVIVMKQNGGTNDLLVWKWLKGAQTEIADFAEPTTTADYTLCVYTGTSQDLVAGAVVPAGTNWTARPRKYKYRDPQANEDGVQKVILKEGLPNKAKVILKGKGGALPDPTMPLAEPVLVQLVNEETNVCWESEFESGDTIKNDGSKYKAKFK